MGTQKNRLNETVLKKCLNEMVKQIFKLTGKKIVTVLQSKSFLIWSYDHTGLRDYSKNCHSKIDKTEILMTNGSLMQAKSSVVPSSRFLGDTGVPLPEFQGDIYKFWGTHQIFQIFTC